MKPDRLAVTIAGFCALDALIAWACGAPYVAVALATTGTVALCLFWRVPLCDDDGNDIEALIEATREDIPDYVPDAWTKELS